LKRKKAKLAINAAMKSNPRATGTSTHCHLSVQEVDDDANTVRWPSPKNTSFSDSELVDDLETRTQSNDNENVEKSDNAILVADSDEGGEEDWADEVFEESADDELRECITRVN
jgi:hypothetical protein